MRDFSPQNQSPPLLYLGEYPLYATHVIALAYIVAMTVTAVAGMDSSLVAHLSYVNLQVLQGQVWRPFTYGLVNFPSVQFAIDILMLVWFGREVEKFYGRRLFLTLFAGIYLLPPILLLAATPVLPVFLVGTTGALAVFVAFATLYPGAVLMFNVLAKWAAIILVGIYSLMAIASRNWGWLGAIWIANGFAHAFVRYQRSEFTLPNPLAWLRRPKFKVLPGQGTEPKRPAVKPTDEAMVDVDALLDKIARSGIHSLTAEERARLDRSSAELMRRKGTVRGRDTR